MSKVKITVIIPTYKRNESLINTINSLLEQDTNEFEILIVDNDPLSELKDRLMSINNSTEIIINYYQEKKIGLHYARNSGALNAEGEILLYTDDDTIMPKTWVSSMLEPFNESNVGAVGGKVIPKWEKEPPEWILGYSNGNLSLVDLGPTPIKFKDEEIKIYGCNMAIRKSIVLENGGFHPELIGDIYYGDGETGFLRKIKTLGWHLLYYPKAYLWHVINDSRMNEKYMCRRYKNQGVSDAFSKFSINRNRKYIQELKWMILASVKIIIRTILQIMLFPLKNKYRNNLFKLAYQKGRLSFLAKYIIDNEYRTVVHEKDWINL